MFILSSSHLRGPLSSERCVQKGVRRLSRRRYAIRSAKVGLVREGIGDTNPGEGIRFGVASNPEFLKEGTAVEDSLYPDRIVVGGDAATLSVMRELYEPLVAQAFDQPPGVPRPSSMISVPLLATSLTSAEMIKYAANAFLAMKIGFANEIANICERVGAEAPEVMVGIGLDSRIGAKFLNAGIGWGGS